ncbi:MAG TPA: phosphatidate cytidylyltransferase [Herpetosiphonaceae bacterium]
MKLRSEHTTFPARSAATDYMREIVRRSVTALLMVPLAVGLIYAGGWLMGAAVALLAAGGTYEFYRLAAQRGIHAIAAPGYAASAGFVLLATAYPALATVAPWLWLLSIALVFVAAAATAWARTADQQPFATIGVTVVGALWTGGSLAFLPLLRHLSADPAFGALRQEALAGFALALFPLALTWTSDSAAYFIGHTWGRHKLLPRVSPGKSWEGAIGGLVAAMLVGVAYALIIFQRWLELPINGLVGALCGAIVAIVGPPGDLAKSALKREAGVKDAGQIFPGHGGIIDRFDALFFVLPVIYGVLRLVLEPTLPGGG